jgi:hypothetical protein
MLWSIEALLTIVKAFVPAAPLVIIIAPGLPVAAILETALTAKERRARKEAYDCQGEKHDWFLH